MEFGLLGSLRVVDGDRVVPVASVKHRILLAALVLRAGEVVSVEELAEAIWGEELPVDPRKVVQIYVTRLRKLLGRDGLILGRPGGYVLAVAGGVVDVGRFEGLLVRAREVGGGGDRYGEAVVLRQALGLWRGEALADVPSEVLRRGVGARLGELWVEAVQRRVDADLALGRHGEVVGELRGLVERFPLREQLWGQLLTALYRCGRQGEALAAYGRVRAVLAEELGVDPGPGLQQLHQAMLRNDPALAVPVGAYGWVGPSQLPLDVADFVGRGGLVAGIEGVLAADGRGVPVVVVSGPAGVGKTALAVHVAHRLVGRFVDGQLYVDLQGSTAGVAPLGPLEVLGRFLRALGVAGGAVPGGVAEAAGLFRSRLAGRRVLVVLDNAADVGQVVPLLPATGGCGVLVTSRRVLSAVGGAHHVRVGVLAVGEAVALLGSLAGGGRVAAEREAAVEVVGLCDCLPLAVRIAGARLAARPGWGVGVLAGRLADAQRRLDELELAQVGVRASFEVSFRQLAESADGVDRAAAAAFGLLGALDGVEVGVGVVARLLDVPVGVAEVALERLVDAQLLETPVPGRYRLHDLLRLYARELGGQLHPAPLRAAALTRAIGWYVACAWGTLAVLRPGDYRLVQADARWCKGGVEFVDERAALAWLDVEGANLVAAVGQAAGTVGVPPELGVQLAQALVGFFWMRSRWAEWVQVNEIALGIARRTGDLAAQARASNDLGGGYWRQGRFEEALACLHEGLAIFRELGDRRGEGLSLGSLGLVYRWQGHYEEALACLHQSLAICRELGDRPGEGLSLGNLGEVYQRLERYEEALDCLDQSLTIRRDLGDRLGQANSLGNIGIVYQRLGRDEEAVACLRESLAICQELGARDSQADSLRDLGIVYQRQGRYQQALDSLHQSLAIRRQLGDFHCEAESLRELGVTLRALGRADEARAHWLDALAIFERLQTTDADQVRALLDDLPPSGEAAPGGCAS